MESCGVIARGASALAFCGGGASLGDSDVGEGLPGEGEMTLHILADDGLLVVAGHVVPLDPVPVEVVQHRHARLTLPCKIKYQIRIIK